MAVVLAMEIGTAYVVMMDGDEYRRSIVRELGSIVVVLLLLLDESLILLFLLAFCFFHVVT